MDLQNSVRTKTNGRPGHNTTNDQLCNDNWAALDFILALEWPCKDHHDHETFNRSATLTTPSSDGSDDLHGHGLTMTAAVYHSMRPVQPPEIDVIMADSSPQTSASTSKWRLDNSEIDK